jgi:hypothetical protein
MMNDLKMDVLSDGLDDWVPLFAVAGFARRRGASTPDEVERALVEALSFLANSKLIEFGEVSDSGFSPWGMPVDGAITRMRELFRLGDRDRWGFLCWTRNTPKGDEVARQLRPDVNTT